MFTSLCIAKQAHCQHKYKYWGQSYILLSSKNLGEFKLQVHHEQLPEFTNLFLLLTTLKKSEENRFEVNFFTPTNFVSKIIQKMRDKPGTHRHEIMRFSCPVKIAYVLKLIVQLFKPLCLILNGLNTICWMLLSLCCRRRA
jgi:hypothetical protein